MTKKEIKTLILSFFLLFIGPGLTFFSYSLFFPSLVEAYGWGRGVTTVGFAGYWVSLGVGSLLTGSLMGPLGLRKMMGIGVAGIGLGFVTLLFVTSPLHLILSYAVIGVGVSLMGIIPVTAILAHQFPVKTGRFLGIAGIGMSAGGLIGSPLIERAITLMGWQTASLLMAVFSWAVGFLTLLFAWPAADFWTGGESLWSDLAGSITRQFACIKDYLKAPRFWWILLITFIGSFGHVAILSHMVAHLQDLGVESTRAALSLSATLFMGILGRIIFGYVADRSNAGLAMLASFLVQAAGLLFLLTGRSTLSILIFLVFFGFGMGPFVSLHAQWVVQLFGTEKFQQSYATIRIASILGASLGPMVTGFGFDFFGSYQWAFIIIILLLLGGSSLLQRQFTAPHLSQFAPVAPENLGRFRGTA